MRMKIVFLVAIVFLGAMIISFRTTSVTNPQSLDTLYPKQRATISEYAQEAKKEGKKKVVIGAPLGCPMHVKSLSDALSKLSLLVTQPVAQKTYFEGGDIITTWIKFKIVEDLSQKDFDTTSVGDLASVLPQEVADALLPVGEDEILVPQAGGILELDGVTVISEIPQFPLLSMDQRYLLFVEKSFSGKLGKTELGAWGVFTITEHGLINPIVPQPHHVIRDIQRFYGDSLGNLKEGLAKRS